MTMADTPNAIVLAVPNEYALVDRCPAGALLFREPDLGDEATAFACFSDGRFLSDLPLAGRVPMRT